MRPKLRILHNLARSGSTLMCKCLGCMDNVALLSEIHPAAMRLFNPLQQAQTWFSLLNEGDSTEVKGDGSRTEFVDAITLINQRCVERGQYLVIRDWAHLDFTGAPFFEMPNYRFQVSDMLETDFELLRLFTVRHPIDQWLSLIRLGIMGQALKDGSLSVEGFLAGYLQYAKQCVQGEWVRYEDFTHDPVAVMRRICEALQLPFDASFIDKWADYQTITGDVQSTRGGREIRPLKRRVVDDTVLQQFESNEDYKQLILMLGY